MIEFRCTQCQSLLRTKDETAGKKARCPSCGTVLPIPFPGAAPPTEGAPTPPPTSPGAADDSGGYQLAPPSGSPPPPPPPPPGAATWGPAGGYAAPRRESLNPFQSPSAWEGAEPVGGVGGVGEGFAPRPVSVDEILSASWAIFQDRLSSCLMALGAFMVVNIMISVLTQVGMAVAQTLPTTSQLALVFLVQGLSMVGNIWLNLGLIRLFLEVARGREGELMLIFSGGTYLLRGLGVIILLMISAAGLLMVMMIPLALGAAVIGSTEATIVAVALSVLAITPVMVYLGCGFAFWNFCLVDLQVGVVETLTSSWQIAQGNRLTIVLLFLLFFLLTIAGLLCCCVGIIFGAAFGWLILTVAYLLMSGQQVMIPPAR